MSRLITLGCVILFTMTLIDAQQPNPPVAPANYDEEKVGDFPLTDPLKTIDGRTVNTPQLWNDVKRPELLKLFDQEMFGTVSPDDFVGPVLLNHPVDKTVFNGKGTRYQQTLFFPKRGPRPILSDRSEPASGAPLEGVAINLLIYTPNNVTGKVPAFVGLNFQGNHTVNADPGILLGKVWQNRQLVPAKEEDRGAQASRWQIEKILDRGYAVVTAYYQDIEPDFDGGSKFGVRQLIEQKEEPNEGNAIATWAWGLSTIRNFVVADPSERFNIDPDRIIVHGHSRLGKTALWAAAIDEKFALAISNNSGCGGAALSRRNYGETVHRINTSFPHWFNGNFKKYNLDVGSLPFDQHELIALIAPRPVYIASAVEDQWADPKGEFLSGLYADPVYRLLGTDGFAGVTEMPELNKSVGGTIGYHIREGVHDVTEFDWEQFLNFADKHFK